MCRSRIVVEGGDTGVGGTWRGRDRWLMGLLGFSVLPPSEVSHNCCDDNHNPEK